MSFEFVPDTLLFDATPYSFHTKIILSPYGFETWLYLCTSFNILCQTGILTTVIQNSLQYAFSGYSP